MASLMIDDGVDEARGGREMGRKKWPVLLRALIEAHPKY